MCCNAKNLLQFKNHFFLTNYVHIYVSQKIKKGWILYSAMLHLGLNSPFWR